MTDMYGPSSGMAARRRTALAASLQLDADKATPAQLKLGRDLAKACMRRAAESKPKIDPPPPRPSLPESHPQERPGDREHSIVAAARIKQQVQLHWDFCSVTRDLEERRFVARHLVIDALHLVPPDERRQFVDLAIQWLEYFEGEWGKSKPPLA